MCVGHATPLEARNVSNVSDEPHFRPDNRILPDSAFLEPRGDLRFRSNPPFRQQQYLAVAVPQLSRSSDKLGSHRFVFERQFRFTRSVASATSFRPVSLLAALASATAATLVGSRYDPYCTPRRYDLYVAL